MQFKGRAQPMTNGGLELASKTAKVNFPTFMAVLEVEARGVGYLNDKRPVILYERHIFSRRTGGKYDKTYPSISNPVIGGYGQSGVLQYQRLELAMRLNEDEALASCSWGLGQIMGFNHARAGYGTTRNMIRDFCDSEDGQVMAVGIFIRNAGLSSSLQRKDWAAFAYGYNGPGFAACDYDRRLERAYERWKLREPINCVLRSQQMHMKWAGYYNGAIDGIYGPLTEAAFQACARDDFAPWNVDAGNA